MKPNFVAVVVAGCGLEAICVLALGIQLVLPSFSAHRRIASPAPAATVQRPDIGACQELPNEVFVPQSGDDGPIDALYRERRFVEAANMATASARANPDPDESSALKLEAQRLKALGVAYTSGMAPAVKATDAFDQLTAATTYDQNLGGRFQSELTHRLALVAPKAALSFAAVHNYEKAHTAVQRAERLGAGCDKNVQLVRTKLEGVAQALYQEAINDPVPASSKDKLRQVRLMVDSKSPWFHKATLALLAF
jgi:hypothetical protein